MTLSRPSSSATRPVNARRRGFTLIELLVVMGILVVLVLIALPVFDYITAARSSEAGVNMASAMLGRARNIALSRGDNKYIGVLFYHDPEGDRDAMQLVEVDAADLGGSFERYLSWQNNAPYTAAITVLPNIKSADVVYSQALDPLIGGTASPFNNRPVVKRYVALQDNTNKKPPDGTLSGTNVIFTDAYWNTLLLGNTVPVALDAEIQYLPRNVRARVIKKTGNTIIRPGMILFDKQGRVVQRRWGIARDNDDSIDGGELLLNAMGLTTDLPMSDDRQSGIAIAVFTDGDTGLADPKDQVAVDTWAKLNADQYTVSTQSGELITGSQQ